MSESIYDSESLYSMGINGKRLEDCTKEDLEAELQWAAPDLEFDKLMLKLGGKLKSRSTKLVSEQISFLMYLMTKYLKLRDEKDKIRFTPGSEERTGELNAQIEILLTRMAAAIQPIGQAS